jgi:hypothetical protein
MIFPTRTENVIVKWLLPFTRGKNENIYRYIYISVIWPSLHLQKELVQTYLIFTLFRCGFEHFQPNMKSRYCEIHSFLIFYPIRIKTVQ